MLQNNRNGAARNSLLNEYSVKVGEAVLRSRTHNAEQKARLEAEVASRIKSEFISNMSHELRTPLNTVIGFSKLLSELDRRNMPMTEIVEYARLIQDAADHLLSLINDILDISKIQSGRYTIDATEIDVDEVLEAVVASFQQSCRDAAVTLESKFGEQAAMTRGDMKKLRQAFSNLIGNAVKFTQQGGHVLVEVVPDANGSTVVIRDTGVGMDEEELRVALMPFGQVDGTRSRWREGAGLGLPIAKALIELHGGRLTIQSAKSMGTEVTVWLPSAEAVTTMERQDEYLGHPAPKTNARGH